MEVIFEKHKKCITLPGDKGPFVFRGGRQESRNVYGQGILCRLVRIKPSKKHFATSKQAVELTFEIVDLDHPEYGGYYLKDRIFIQGNVDSKLFRYLLAFGASREDLLDNDGIEINDLLGNLGYIDISSEVTFKHSLNPSTRTINPDEAM